MKAFDDAVAVGMAYAAHNRDTLVLVTADHECAGFNIIEKGTFTNAEATRPPANADGGNTANNSIPLRTTGPVRDDARSSGPVNGSGSGSVTNFGPATFRTADDPVGVVDGDPAASLWLSYLSGNHTGADVPIFSGGPGSDAFRGLIDNTDIYTLMKGALRAFRT
jgi:alkaline phosphatase